MKAQVATTETAATETSKLVEAPVTIVTGASRGIGKAVALALGAAGAKVGKLALELSSLSRILKYIKYSTQVLVDSPLLHAGCLLLAWVGCSSKVFVLVTSFLCVSLFGSC